jgi:nitrite reductase (NADH) small subunit/3-phenylpropionate/trans-cinnamate dioxygenase ferredoxin subunit
MGGLIKVAKLSDVPPGTGRQVEVGGRPLALFNVGGTIHVIGGECTHSGGPLGEGELDDTVVTCPWHHAEFDVVSGEAVGSPADDSVPVYKVVVEGDDITVEVP